MYDIAAGFFTVASLLCCITVLLCVANVHTGYCNFTTIIVGATFSFC